MSISFSLSGAFVTELLLLLLQSLPVSALRQGPQSFPVTPSLPPRPLLPPHLLLGSSQDRARTALEYVSKVGTFLPARMTLSDSPSKFGFCN